MNDRTEHQFPRFLLQRNEKLCPDDPFFGDLPGLRRSNGWEWDVSLLRNNPDSEVSVGTEFAAHYVKLLKDSGDTPVGNVLGRDLVPILAEAPVGVQIGFYSAIEKLLTEHSPEPFDALKAYAQEEDEEERTSNAQARPSEDTELGDDTPAECCPARLMKEAAVYAEWKPVSSQPFHDSGLFDILAIPEKLDMPPDELFHTIFHMTMAAIVSGDAVAINAASDLMIAAEEISKRSEDQRKARQVERLNGLVKQVSLDLTSAESLELFGSTDGDYDSDGAQMRLRQCLFELGKAAA